VSPRYRRRRAEPEDQAVAGVISAAVGVGVGLVAFYFLRLMLTREPLPGGSVSPPQSPDREE